MAQQLKSSPSKPKNDTALHQIAALPLRAQDGELEVCLITTRETKRWTVPKGWPMKQCKDFEAAQIEAEEEAGIQGIALKRAFGTYSYWKRRPNRLYFIEVKVYPLLFQRQMPSWKEMAERDTRWMPIAEAAALVEEPSLQKLLQDLRSKKLLRSLEAVRTRASE